MTRRIEILLLLLGFCTALLASQGVNSPGYMDADYYFSMGLQWSRGAGGQEPFLWNYLSDPESIPTVSHTYWHPLTAIAAGLSMRLLGSSFRFAQIPFILFTSLLPLITYRVARRLGLKEMDALISAFFSLAPGYFLPFLVTTDSFSLYAIISGMLFVALPRSHANQRWLAWLLTGILCGLGHLTRADGFLLLSIPLYASLSTSERKLKGIVLVLAGYVLTMLPWFLRNLNAFGSPLTAGGAQTFWLLSYDELFSYPALKLTFTRWLSQGLGTIFLQRWYALLVILQRLIAENGLVFLFPFMAVGIIKNWRQVVVRAAVIYLSLLAVLMIVVFPYAGSRGGWFHSSIAIMPLLWSVAVIGLKTSISWVGLRRGWDSDRAHQLYSTTAIGLAILITWGLYAVRVLGIEPGTVAWDKPEARYKLLSESLNELDADPGTIAINNPPGFYHVSGLESVVLPNEDVVVLKDLVERYTVEWVVIDKNTPVGLRSLFEGESIPDWLDLQLDRDLLGERTLLFHVEVLPNEG